MNFYFNNAKNNIAKKKKKNFITFCFHNWNHITCFCYLEQNIATNLYVKLYLNLCCRINSRNSKNRRRIETSFFTTSSQDKSRWKILLKEDIFDRNLCGATTVSLARISSAWNIFHPKHEYLFEFLVLLV